MMYDDEVNKNEVRIGGVLYVPVESESFVEGTVGAIVHVKRDDDTTPIVAVELKDIKADDGFSRIGYLNSLRGKRIRLMYVDSKRE